MLKKTRRLYKVFHFSGQFIAKTKKVFLHFFWFCGFCMIFDLFKYAMNFSSMGLKFIGLLLNRWLSKLPRDMYSYTSSGCSSSRQYPMSFTRRGCDSCPMYLTLACAIRWSNIACQTMRVWHKPWKTLQINRCYLHSKLLVIFWIF